MIFNWQTEFAKIIAMAQKGNDEAFAIIIDNTQAKFFRFCVYLCSDVHLAQDICQDVYIKAIESLKSFESEAKLFSWLFKAAKNHYIDYTRNHNNQQFVDLESISNEYNSADTPDNKFHITEVLQMLEPKLRIALILIDGEGYSYKEAAEIIDVSEDTLRARLHKARKYFLEKAKK